MPWPPTTCRWRSGRPSGPARRPWRPGHSSTRRGTSSGLSSSSTRSRYAGSLVDGGRAAVLRLAGRGGELLDGPCPCRAAVGGGHRGRSRPARASRSRACRLRQRRLPTSRRWLHARGQRPAREPPSSPGPSSGTCPRPLCVERRSRRSGGGASRWPSRGDLRIEALARRSPSGPAGKGPRDASGEDPDHGSFVASSVYFNIGYLSTGSATPRGRERSVDRSACCPGRPAVRARGRTCRRAWDAGRRVVAKAARDAIQVQPRPRDDASSV